MQFSNALFGSDVIFYFFFFYFKCYGFCSIFHSLFIYHSIGKLTFSRTNIYQIHILTKINPEAYYHFSAEHVQETVQG